MYRAAPARARRRATIRPPAAIAARRARRAGRAVPDPLTSAATPCSRATSGRASRSTAFSGGGRSAARWDGSAAHVQLLIASIDPLGHLRPAASAGRRGRSPAPVELPSTSSGRSSRRGEMSHSIPRRTRNSASASFAAAISSRLAATRRRSDPGPRRPPACGRRSQGSRRRARARPGPSRPRWRGRRTTSCGSAGRRGCRRARAAAAARRGTAPRAARAGTTGCRARRRRRLIGRVRESARGRDVGGGAPVTPAARCRGLRRRDDEDRPALDRHAPERTAPPARRPLDRGCTPGGEGGGGARGRAARGEPLARVAPAAGSQPARRRPGLASGRGARARGGSMPRPRREQERGAPSPTASASRICRSNFGPTPGTARRRPTAAAARNSSGVLKSSARASSTARFTRSARGSGRGR